MNDKKDEVENIFLEALQIESLPSRNEFLDKKCGNKGELRELVESLLAANQDMGSFLDRTKDGSLPSFTDQIEEKIGTRIGPYELLAKIGAGGMGVVYIAQQHEPVRRRVALKLIKPGMDSGEVLARFEAERQALAIMDHPNIAKVLDAGATDKGRPFFVMELVQGAEVTDYCDEKQLDPNDRLELFIDVCRAIQHAHQKGIIHRDIKPSNVLVASHDGIPVVKVIDFGVAKAIDQQLTERTIATYGTQVIGTPLYMSPEQAGLTGLDVDTRTDVYSLGVLLYELLTGETPFNKQRMRQAAFDEMRRIIRDEEPPRPSTKISTLGDTVSTISLQRKTDPKKLRKMLRGDIDWIVMKAIEKDRSRRYETANGLAMDVERYLAQEPVAAGPPSMRYRVGKFASRNRAGVIAASLVAAALILGFLGTGSGLVWALNENHRANVAANKAEVKEKTSRGILDFFIGLFEEASPRKRMGKPMTLAEFLDVGSERIVELGHQPDTLAALQETIGSLYIVLSEYDKAEPLLLAALNYRQARSEESQQDEVAYASVLGELGALYQWTDIPKGETLARQASEILERTVGDTPELADTLNILGNCLQRQDKIPESMVAHKKSLAIREKLWPPGHVKHDNVATALHNIGIAYFYESDLPEAEQYIQRAIEIEQEYSDVDDPSLATGKHVLSIVYANQSKFENAKKWQLESFATRQKVFEADHDHVGLSNNWLGNIYRGLKRYTEAEPLLRRAVEIHTEVYSKDNELVLWDSECLLKGLIKLEKFDEALQLQEELFDSVEGKETGFTNRRSLSNLKGDIQFAEGDLDRSRETYQATLQMAKDLKDGPGRFAAEAQLKLLVIDAMQDRPFSQAKYDQAIQGLMKKEKWNATDARLLQTQTDIADALYDAGKTDQAAEIYRTVRHHHESVAQQENVDPFLLDGAARFLATCKVQSLRDVDMGMSFSERANQMTDSRSPHYLSTLAIAQHANGNTDQAAALQQTAIDKLPDSSFWAEQFKELLDDYKSIED